LVGSCGPPSLASTCVVNVRSYPTSNIFWTSRDGTFGPVFTSRYLESWPLLLLAANPSFRADIIHMACDALLAAGATPLRIGGLVVACGIACGHADESGSPRVSEARSTDRAPCIIPVLTEIFLDIFSTQAMALHIPPIGCLSRSSTSPSQFGPTFLIVRVSRHALSAWCRIRWKAPPRGRRVSWGVPRIA